MTASSRPRFFAWWYLSIALGFLLLTVRQILIGANLPGIIVRLVIAAGFAFLAIYEFRSQSRT